AIIKFSLGNYITVALPLRMHLLSPSRWRSGHGNHKIFTGKLYYGCPAPTNAPVVTISLAVGARQS
ncbi:hypothetical protein, partial [Microseira wollei]|uniref:hypothetical protein n=1 Tax=Microseira wollei TaxID=467598 RepID=UPI001CFE2B81